MPFTTLGDASAGKLDNYVHRIGIVYVTGKEGTYSIRVHNPATDIFVYLYRPVNVETVAVAYLLGGRVYAQLSVLGDYLFSLLLLVSAVNTQTLVHHSHTLAQITEEHLVAEAVVKIDTVVAVIYVAEFFHHVEVALEHSADVFFEGYELV